MIRSGRSRGVDVMARRIAFPDSEEPRQKDAWDKADIVGKLTSGVFLALLGIFVTVTIDGSQKALTERIAASQESAGRDIAHAQIVASTTNADSQIKEQEFQLKINAEQSREVKS